MVKELGNGSGGLLYDGFNASFSSRSHSSVAMLWIAYK
jgi:hypothetical protein